MTIAEVRKNAEGKMDQAFAFAGSNEEQINLILQNKQVFTFLSR